MQTSMKSLTKAVRPSLRYRNISKAVDWLTTTLGFHCRRFEKSDTNEIIYAELEFGESIIVLGSTGGELLNEMMMQPDEIDGSETQICYLVVENIEPFYERAKAEGAEVLFYLTHDDTIGEGFSCRDLEGHIWHVATYEPKTIGAIAPTPAVTPAPMPKPELSLDFISPQQVRTALSRHAPMLTVAGFVAVFGGLLTAYSPQKIGDGDLAQASTLQSEVNSHRAQLASEKQKQQKAERTAALTNDKVRKVQDSQVLSDNAIVTTQRKLVALEHRVAHSPGQVIEAQDAREDRQAVDAELERLRAAAQSADESSKALANAKQALAEQRQSKTALEGALKKTEKQLANLNKTQDKMRKKLASLEVELDSEKKRRLAVKGKVHDAEEALAKVNDEKQNLLKRVAALQTSIDGLKEERQTELGRAAAKAKAQKAAKAAKLKKAKKAKKARQRKIARAKAAQERRKKKIAKKKAATTTATPSQTPGGPSKVQLLAMKKELKRMGCVSGSTGGWDIDSADALDSFIQNNKRRVGYQKGQRVRAKSVLRALRATRSNVCQ